MLIVAIPFLRPLRIVRSLRAVRLLRTLRLVAFASRFLDTSRVVLTRHGLQYALIMGLVFVLAAAGLVALLEDGVASATTGNFGEALWWALATVTTVGYGDVSPVSTEARGVGILLMSIGIGVFSVLTANVAALFVESDTRNDSVAELVALEVRLERLELLISDLHTSVVGNGDSLERYGDEPPPTPTTSP